MTELVTVACQDDFDLLLIQLKSIDKYLDPCVVNVVINEKDISTYKDKIHLSNHKIKIWSQYDILDRNLDINGWLSQQLLKLLIPINCDYICLDAKDIFLKPTKITDLARTQRKRLPDPRTTKPWIKFYHEMIRKLFKKYKVRINSKNVYHIQTPRYIKNEVVSEIPKIWKSKKKFINWWLKFGMPSEFMLYDCLEMCVGLREKANNKFTKNEIVSYWYSDQLNFDLVTEDTRIVKIHRRIFNDPNEQSKVKKWLNERLTN